MEVPSGAGASYIFRKIFYNDAEFNNTVLMLSGLTHPKYLRNEKYRKYLNFSWKDRFLKDVEEAIEKKNKIPRKAC